MVEIEMWFMKEGDDWLVVDCVEMKNIFSLTISLSLSFFLSFILLAFGSQSPLFFDFSSSLLTLYQIMLGDISIDIVRWERLRWKWERKYERWLTKILDFSLWQFIINKKKFNLEIHHFQIHLIFHFWDWFSYFFLSF